jgi:hypothetical protein
MGSVGISHGLKPAASRARQRPRMDFFNEAVAFGRIADECIKHCDKS